MERWLATPKIKAVFPLSNPIFPPINQLIFVYHREHPADLSLVGQTEG